MNLRNYQSETVEAVFREWESGTISTLVVLPTGAGKTVVFSEIIRRAQPKRCLVLAHREELIFQAREKIEKIAGIECDIEMAEMRASLSLFNQAQCVIATVQTMSRRLEQFDPYGFQVVIVDECHHSTANSYQKILNHFKINPDIRILGVTATPDRADEEALGQIFDTVAYDYEILDAIHDGWLVPVEQQMVHIADLDFSNVRTTAGDLNGADLSAVMEVEATMQGIVGSSIDILGGRQALLFAASVKQAEMSCEIFNRHRVNMATFICGTTERDKRAEIFDAFRNGKYQVLCNCGIATEGTDLPMVEVILNGRPTKSRSLYAQIAGRALRPLPGTVDGLETPDERKSAIAGSAKPSALLVDFVGNSGRHKLMSATDILGGKVSQEAVDAANEEALSAGKAVDIIELLEGKEKEIQDALEERKRLEEARKAKLVAKVSYSTQKIDPFTIYHLKPVQERGWHHGKVLSEKQRALLLKMGVDGDSMPYAQAKQLIDHQFKRWKEGLATLKQCNTLKRFGYDAAGMKMSDASSLLDRIAKNGWKRLPEVTPA